MSIRDDVRNLLARAFGIAQARRFEITVTPPQGEPIRLYRNGGTSVDHALEGMEIGGIGSKVKVQRVKGGA